MFFTKLHNCEIKIVNNKSNLLKKLNLQSYQKYL